MKKYFLYHFSRIFHVIVVALLILQFLVTILFILRNNFSIFIPILEYLDWLIPVTLTMLVLTLLYHFIAWVSLGFNKDKILSRKRRKKFLLALLGIFISLTLYGLMDVLRPTICCIDATFEEPLPQVL